MFSGGNHAPKHRPPTHIPTHWLLTAYPTSGNGGTSKFLIKMTDSVVVVVVVWVVQPPNEQSTLPNEILTPQNAWKKKQRLMMGQPQKFQLNPPK